MTTKTRIERLRAGAYLLQQFKTSSPVFKSISGRFFSPKPTEAHVDNLANPALKTLIVASLLQDHQVPILVVCPDPQEVQRYYRDLLELLPEDSISAYPSEDFSPYDLSTPLVKTIREQHELGEELASGRQKVYLIAAKSLVLKHVSVLDQEEKAFLLQVDQTISPLLLAGECLSRGYTKTSIVLEPGEFSNRGDIFDIYPVTGTPVRIEFFGDTIETIRQMNTENQRSVAKVDSVKIIARNTLLLSEDNKNSLIIKMRSKLAQHLPRLQSVEAEALNVSVENQVQALEQAFIPDGLDYYAPLLDAHFQVLPSFLPENAILIFDNWSLIDNNLQGFVVDSIGNF
jgi:transcription-repair coupling factor (superfamily II helicase)